MFNLVIEYLYFHIKTSFKMILKQKIKQLLKTFSSVFIYVDNPGQDIIVINIPVIIAKKNQIIGQGLKTLNISLNIMSEYDQEIPQSQTACKPISSRGRVTYQSLDTWKTN